MRRLLYNSVYLSWRLKLSKEHKRTAQVKSPRHTMVLLHNQISSLVQGMVRMTLMTKIMLLEMMMISCKVQRQQHQRQMLLGLHMMLLLEKMSYYMPC
ncbi:hypothetical protein GQ55_3G393700 [Panicum hallii var. hallii]|uniref:Uncharacterized protein n=1 Tax=Panicum hallii var. hallii TaxID=1504633 RepID=A0A2T7EGN0_9POAL|nr:hypothetical protein GQ55_3G393700 [Panicum hallii var. hallii]